AVSQPQTLKDTAIQKELADTGADVMVVAAYGLILPAAVLTAPVRGCLNIHASLLPRWRGAAPIQRAILAGDRETGITIMQMDAGLDTGAMLLREAIPIAPDDTAQTLHDKLAEQGGRLIAAALERLDSLHPDPQNEAEASYAAKLSKEEARIDWQRTSTEIERAVRAYIPFPVAFTSLKDETLRIWRAKEEEGSGRPGEILSIGANGIVVACGKGALCIEEVQKPGGKRLSATNYLQGNPLQVGDRCA
ncbi:MAG: methionyl-tRNA formyltransferase, partial [Notoacmeibacter sp.]|nr:methionyl-tRNA formyltransferase [Notoacmeibacter sp.]